MNTGRNLISWLLLGLLTVLALGAAALGIVQAPKNAPLISCASPQQPIQHCTGAVPNTLAAANYSQVLSEDTPQGKQTDYLVYQAPDRLGGYIQSGSKRTYVYVIGKFEYQSLTVANNASTNHLVLYRQPSQGAQALDPAHGYLPYAKSAKDVQQSGDTYSFTLSETTSQGKETGTFVVHRLGLVRVGVHAQCGRVLGAADHLPGGFVATRLDPGRGQDRRGDGRFHHWGLIRPGATGSGETQPGPPDRARSVNRLMRLRPRRWRRGAVGRDVPGRRPRHSQRTTTKCRAPAAAMAPTVAGSTPPVIHTGHGDRATASLM